MGGGVEGAPRLRLPVWDSSEETSPALRLYESMGGEMLAPSMAGVNERPLEFDP